MSAGATKERVKTPDSPEGARLMLSTATPTSAGGNSNSTSPTTATISSSTTTLRYATTSGLTATLQNGANGQAVSTGNVSPVLNGSAASGGESHTLLVVLFIVTWLEMSEPWEQCQAARNAEIRHESGSGFDVRFYFVASELFGLEGYIQPIRYWSFSHGVGIQRGRNLRVENFQSISNHMRTWATWWLLVEALRYKP